MNNIDKLLIADLNKLPVDFWDFKSCDTKSLIHGIHSYPATMIYPISQTIISLISKYKEINSLLDPFMGSGTVLVEGMLSGIENIYGNDLNPLALLISKVKTTFIDNVLLESSYKLLLKNINERYSIFNKLLTNIYREIELLNLDISADIKQKGDWGENAYNILLSLLEKYGLTLNVPNFKNIGFWFVPNAIIELQLIKNCISEIDDKEVRNFFLLSFSEIVRLVSNRRNGEFKMYRMIPEKVANFRPNVLREFIKLTDKNVKKMQEFYLTLSNNKKNQKIVLTHDDARTLNNIPNDSVDLVITSPPYGDSRTTVSYGEFSKVSLQWLELKDYESIINVDKILMGGEKFNKGFNYDIHSQTLLNSLNRIMLDPSNSCRAGDVYSFYKDLELSIEAINKKCRKGSYQFWVVGNRTVKKEKLKTDIIITEIADYYGLEHIYTINRNILNKVMPSLNAPNNVSGNTVSTMTNEHIVILKKAE